MSRNRKNESRPDMTEQDYPTELKKYPFNNFRSESDRYEYARMLQREGFTLAANYHLRLYQQESFWR